jgi:hypothetical protein
MWFGFDAGIWLEAEGSPFTLDFGVGGAGQGRRVAELVRGSAPGVPVVERPEWVDVLLIPRRRREASHHPLLRRTGPTDPQRARRR